MDPVFVVHFFLCRNIQSLDPPETTLTKRCSTVLISDVLYVWME